MSVPRSTRIELEHPVTGRMPGIASPMRFSKTAVSYDRAPPLLGQHLWKCWPRSWGLSIRDRGAHGNAGAI